MPGIHGDTSTPLSATEIRSIFLGTTSELPCSAAPPASLPVILEPMPKRIEHTLLKADAALERITQLCSEAEQHGFRGVCCLPRHVAYCQSLLEGSSPLVVSVVDFPLCGATPLDAAVLAQRAVSDGADEVDMVLDVSSSKAARWADVFERIALVVESCEGTPVKVILETGFLTETEIVISCAIARAAGAAFVKTSTGFGPRGASLRDIEIMRLAVGDTMRIKASGGIKDAAFAQSLIDAGADVIGTSAGPVCIGK